VIQSADDYMILEHIAIGACDLSFFPPYNLAFEEAVMATVQ